MHRIRHWMSSVALIMAAGLVIAALRQHFSDASPPPMEPARLFALPLPKPAAKVAAQTEPALARPAQHTYPVREPSAEPRQPWAAELPLDDLIAADRRGTPSRPTARPAADRVEQAREYEARPATQRRPAPRVQYDERDTRLADNSRPELEPPVQRRVRQSVEEPIAEEREESILVRQPARKSSVRQTPREELPEDVAPQRRMLPPQLVRPARAQVDSNNPAMRAVLDKAREHTRHGFSLAQRGATYSARSEFIQTLRVVAQAYDAQAGSDDFSRSLAAGLKALEEADDFAPRGSQLEAHLDMPGIVNSHETPVMKSVPPAELNPLRALQAYYGYAREHLAAAAGQTVAGSEALFSLGKLQTETGKMEGRGEQMPQAKGMVYHQAALDADQRNYQAANELAVLLARHGQWESAKQLFIHSVQLRPQPEVWHNLATVHATLGEADLAQRADYERKLLQGDQSPAAAGQVQWLDPAAFAATGPQGPGLPRTGQPTASGARPPVMQQPAAQSASKWPWSSFLR